MSDDTGESARWTSLMERLDELTRELRRQGRAAIAAQAASESCLEKLGALDRAMREERQGDGEGRDERGDDEGDDENDENDENDEREAEARAQEAATWLEGLMPVADAIERAASHAAEVAERARRPRRLLLWPFGRKPDVGADLDALASGLRVLCDQLAAALESRGVRIERRVGVEVDPELHRVVAVRAPASRKHEREGTVLEVIRPGYAVGRRIVRETDVIAAGRASSGK